VGLSATPVSWIGLPLPEWMILTLVVPDAGTVTCGGLNVISFVPPMQSPAPHCPPATHALTFSHEIPSAALESAGQLIDVPEQDSAVSHWPPDSRHTVPATLNASAGQATERPVHVSGASQSPAAARHAVVEG
jgi:hypothetical protein